MLKTILLAATVLGFCSTSLLAQTEQVFVTFGEGANVSSTATFDINDGSGSAFIFSDADLDITAFDLDFFTTANDVIEFTGAEVFNPINTLGQPRFEDDSIIQVVEAFDGRFLALAISASGVNPGLGAAGLDPGFDAEANAFRIARIDFDIVGIGTADITLSLGINEFFSRETPNELFQPTFGNGSLTVTSVPEPSTTGLLALGLVGFVTRRGR